MKKTALIIALIALFVIFFAPSVKALPATYPEWYRDYGTDIGLGDANLEIAVIRIIRHALTFLGLIAVVIIIYGGLLWMTAAGNEEKVSKAKRTITAAVIGLIVVMLAWAIFSFVVWTITNATNPVLIP